MPHRLQGGGHRSAGFSEASNESGTMARFSIRQGSTTNHTNMKSDNEYYENEDSDRGGFTTGLLVGAVVGAAIALLFAPKSGEQTRQQLKDLADQQKDNLKNEWEKTKDKVATAVDNVREKADLAAQHAENTVDTYAEKAMDKVIQVADGAKSTVDKFRSFNDNLGQHTQI